MRTYVCVSAQAQNELRRRLEELERINEELQRKLDANAEQEDSRSNAIAEQRDATAAENQNLLKWSVECSFSLKFFVHDLITNHGIFNDKVTCIRCRRLASFIWTISDFEPRIDRSKSAERDKQVNSMFKSLEKLKKQVLVSHPNIAKDSSLLEPTFGMGDGDQELDSSLRAESRAKVVQARRDGWESFVFDDVCLFACLLARVQKYTIASIFGAGAIAIVGGVIAFNRAGSRLSR